MNNGYIAVIDSGIGGLSVLAAAAKLMPSERFLYFGDNKNAPYGGKSHAELSALMRKDIDYVLKYEVKAVMVGCNTLSVSVMPEIAPEYNVPFFGIYPPVTEKNGTALLFATPVTCKRYADKHGVIPVALEGLAFDIEKNKMHPGSVDLEKHLKNGLVMNKSGIYDKDAIDTVILGCTHYFFIKNQFYDHFCPRKIISGENNTAKRVKYFLECNSFFSNRQSFTVDFIGENSEENFLFYNSVVKDMILNG